MTDAYVPRHAKQSAPIGPDSEGPGRHAKQTPSESFESANSLGGEATSLPRQENRANGRRTLNMYSTAHSAGEKIKSHERLFSDYGVSILNRGDLTNNLNRPIEDAAYVNAKHGVFAVFDGAGGINGGAEASATAAHALDYCLGQQGAPDSIGEMRSLMESINRSVTTNPKAGMTTAVVGRIIENAEGRRQLLYASVGDSRLYHLYEDQIRLVTHDEGYGNKVTNSFGKANGQPVCQGVNQVGLVPLEKGDFLLFNSDGITGDYEKDFIPEREISHLIKTAPSPKDAADRLVGRATKVDDRTALVVKI